jgi:hypothetical protein
MASKFKKAERALMASARARGFKGARAKRYVFGTLNNIGLMRGSKVTPRGRSPAHKGRR